jgi:hypothetical protein
MDPIIDSSERTDQPSRGEPTMPFASLSVPVPMPQAKSHSGAVSEGFTIDCADCIHRNTSVCDDCVVSFIVDRQPDDAVVIDASVARAVRLLEQGGLVPGVRHARQVS